jgi:hypothetical protein
MASPTTVNPSRTFQFRHICTQSQMALRGEVCCEDMGVEVTGVARGEATGLSSRCGEASDGVCSFPWRMISHIMRPIPTGQANTGKRDKRYCICVVPPKGFVTFGTTLDYSIGDNDTIVKGTINGGI